MEKKLPMPNLDLLLHDCPNIKYCPTFLDLQKNAEFNDDNLREICNQELKKAYKAMDADGNVFKCMSPALLTAQAYFGRLPVIRPKPVPVYTRAEAIANQSTKRITAAKDDLWRF